MKKELQTILLLSVALCLFFITQLFKEPVSASNRHLFSGIASWQPPVLNRVSNQSNSDQTVTPSPFTPRFFEMAALKGFIRNSSSEWCAIFNTPEGEARILEPGITKSGLTLISSNGRYCRVKFGSVILEFKL